MLICLPPELWNYDHVYIWFRVLGIEPKSLSLLNKHPTNQVTATGPECFSSSSTWVLLIKIIFLFDFGFCVRILFSLIFVAVLTLGLNKQSRPAPTLPCWWRWPWTFYPHFHLLGARESFSIKESSEHMKMLMARFGLWVRSIVLVWNAWGTESHLN